MRIRLRSKILLLAILAPAVLGLAALGLVNRRVSAQVRSTVDENLSSSTLVCERVLEARSRALESSAHVIIEDPRFFSVVVLGDSHGDEQVRATVEEVARDFNRIAKTDLFEVFDTRGRLVASIGRDASQASQRRALIARSKKGRTVTGLLDQRGIMLQAVAVRAVAGGRRVGTLLIGQRMGDDLAAELRALTKSHVTFLSEHEVTGSTLDGNLAKEVLKWSRATAPTVRGETGSGKVVAVRTGGQLLDALQAHPGSTNGIACPLSVATLTRPRNDVPRGHPARIGGVAIFILIPAIIIGLMVSVEITRPVLELVRAAEEMERGNYDSPLVVRSRDEIGYLAERFRDMRQNEREYVNALEEIARLKSDFISVVSHELRTPVTVIKAYGELLADGRFGPVTAEQRNAIETMGRNLKAIVRISDNASALAHLQGERAVLEKEECAIGVVIREAVAAAVTDAPQRRLDVVVNIDPNLGRMRVDGTRLGQAIAHLVRNAIRFTPDDGSVGVSARQECDDLVVEVSDTGVGISEERQAHLFTRSFLVRDPLNHHSSSALEFNSAGLGLGLPIARGVVQAHRGSISVSSRPGEGSTFMIRIPAQPARDALEAA